jgi:hypothetical protein
MNKEIEYFSENDEWTHQEREFANRAIRQIGMESWQALLKIQRELGTEAFVKATSQIWPQGMPPADS